MKFKIVGLFMALVFTGLVYADEIVYDDGTPGGMSSNTPDCPAYFAVRCGPVAASQKCQVEGVKAMTHVYTGDAQVCSIFVWTDNSGFPGNMMDSKDFIPIKAEDASWVETQFFTGALFGSGSYFWVGVWIAPDDGTNINLICSDNSLGHTNGNAGKSASQGWTILTEGQGDWQIRGDLMIRAIVTYTGIEEEGINNFREPILKQNSPNPLFKETMISYTVPQAGEVSLRIYDITGKLVRTLVDGVQTVGLNKAVWNRLDNNGTEVSSGAYFYRLSANGKTITKVMTVL